MLHQTISTDKQVIMKILAEKLVRCLKGTVHTNINLIPSQSNLYTIFFHGTQNNFLKNILVARVDSGSTLML